MDFRGLNFGPGIQNFGEIISQGMAAERDLANQYEKMAVDRQRAEAEAAYKTRMADALYPKQSSISKMEAVAALKGLAGKEVSESDVMNFMSQLGAKRSEDGGFIVTPDAAKRLPDYIRQWSAMAQTVQRGVNKAAGNEAQLGALKAQLPSLDRELAGLVSQKKSIKPPVGQFGTPPTEEQLIEFKAAQDAIDAKIGELQAQRAIVMNEFAKRGGASVQSQVVEQVAVVPFTPKIQKASASELGADRQTVRKKSTVEILIVDRDGNFVVTSGGAK